MVSAGDEMGCPEEEMEPWEGRKKCYLLSFIKFHSKTNETFTFLALSFRWRRGFQLFIRKNYGHDYVDEANKNQ